QMNDELGLDAQFICADVYSSPEFLNKKFDIVYTTYGVLGWLPDMQEWAQVVRHFLKPGGKMILVEFHPFVWTLDENFDHVKYYYFNKEDITELEEGTYADRYSTIKYESISWNHNFSEVFQSLLNVGLHIQHFEEYDYSPYACFNKLVKIGEDKYQVEGLEGKIPMVYSLVVKA
ncbi:MAG TPA: class I SAM-dependent methyltransferase, partial [Saprospiraceae bacterium]|nr:class I SAM-dependent methyltransferase [Saprospiraceae bacterium]